jgi:alcohol dehydrogenase
MTAYTGMDAFFHAVESFLNLNRQPMNDMLALEAVHLIAHYLPELVNDPENLELRAIQAWASTAAGICESIGGCISHHSLEHALSAMNTDLTHGAGLVMLSLPYFTRLAELAPARFDDLAAAMGREDVDDLPEEERPRVFLEELAKLIAAIGLADETLAQHGFTPENAGELADIAMNTMGGLFPVTPGNMTRDDVVDIFRAAIS